MYGRTASHTSSAIESTPGAGRRGAAGKGALSADCATRKAGEERAGVRALHAPEWQRILLVPSATCRGQTFATRCMRLTLSTWSLPQTTPRIYEGGGKKRRTSWPSVVECAGEDRKVHKGVMER